MKTKIAAALVAACLLTALALVAVRGPSPASPSDATGAAAGPLVAAPAAGADSGPETVDAAADLAALKAARPTITLRGRVLDGDGTPVAGVAVRSAAAADGELPERVSTADDGRFEWREPLTDREVQAVELRFRHPQFVARNVAAHSLRGQPVTLGDVVLTRGGRVSGRVVDDRGEPVAGALVQPGEIDAAFPWREFGDWATSGPSATTDAEGRFSLGGVPEGWYRLYAVGAETYYGRPASPRREGRTSASRSSGGTVRIRTASGSAAARAPMPTARSSFRTSRPARSRSPAAGAARG